MALNKQKRSAIEQFGKLGYAVLVTSGIKARLTAQSKLKKQTLKLTQLGVTAADVKLYNKETKAKSHDCFDNAVPYESDGALGHGWECGICGKFLQAG